MESRKLISLLLILTSLSAYAETKAISGPFISAQTGYSSGFNHENTAIRSTSTGDVNFGGSLGYDFAINDSVVLGAEVNINYTPNISSYTVPSLSGKLDSLVLPFLGTVKYVLPIGLNFFAKGGIAYQRLTNELSGIVNKTASSTSWNGVIAGGIGWQISSFNIFAQYMYLFGDDLTDWNSSSINNTTLSQQMITGGVSYTLAM
jgi:hypothetical protein